MDPDCAGRWHGGVSAVVSPMSFASRRCRRPLRGEMLLKKAAGRRDPEQRPRLRTVAPRPPVPRGLGDAGRRDRAARGGAASGEVA